MGGRPADDVLPEQRRPPVQQLTRPVAPWVCPECRRQFRRKGQGHECAPAMELEEDLASGPAHERPIVEAVLGLLDEAVGPVHVEPVSVGLFLKRSQTFAELRPMVRWEALWFALARRDDHPRITRRMGSPPRTYHVVRLHTPGDVDDQVRDWLVEAYFASPE